MKRRPAIIRLLLAAFLLCTAAAIRASDSLRDDILSLIPQQSGQVGFMDLRTLRNSSQFAFIKGRFMPPRFAEFERFLRPFGVDTDSSLDWLAWALTPAGAESGELFIGVAQGQFKPAEVEAHFQARELPVATFYGRSLFPFGRTDSPQALYFTFLDASTAAFGTRESLELLLRTQLGEQASLWRNESLLPLILEANGNRPIWVVLDDHYTRLAIRQLMPEAAKLDQFKQAAETFVSSTIELEIDREWTLRYTAGCARPEDAQVLALLLQTGLAAKSWSLKEDNPALSEALTRVAVQSVGDRIVLETTVEEESLPSILSQKALP